MDACSGNSQSTWMTLSAKGAVASDPEDQPSNADFCRVGAGVGAAIGTEAACNAPCWNVEDGSSGRRRYVNITSTMLGIRVTSRRRGLVRRRGGACGVSAEAWRFVRLLRTDRPGVGAAYMDGARWQPENAFLRFTNVARRRTRRRAWRWAPVRVLWLLAQ